MILAGESGMLSEDKVMLGTMPTDQANKIKGRLAVHGVEVMTLINPKGCNTGCSITVEMWALPKDIPLIGQVIAEMRKQDMAGLEFDEAQINSVYDTEKEEAICPACGTSFSTRLTECPECGLNFA